MTTPEFDTSRLAAYEAADAWLRHAYHESYMERLVIEHDIRALELPPFLKRFVERLRAETP